MKAKFIQYFDILSGKEEEFRNFSSKNYIPGINDMGLLKIVGSWYVAAGEGPYCIFESMADSVKNINKLLQLEEFGKLNNLLHFLTTNYKTKILAPTGRVESIVPEHKNFRFNHHYDVIYDKYDDYLKFIKEAHIPTMEELGVTIIGGWYVAVGPAPNIVIEGSCTSIEQILYAVGSEKYQELTAKLLTMVKGFGSKILVDMGLIS